MRKAWSFDGGRNGFHYADDAFRFTSEPRYARGVYDDRGSLSLLLGGRDDEPVQGMSGGWSHAFRLDEAETVTLRFRVKLIQGPDVTAKQFADVRVMLDGEPVEIGRTASALRLYGDGVGGARQTTGWTTIEVDLGPVAAGRHEFTLGGFANRKASADAYSRILFDDVRLDSAPPPPPKLGAFEADVLRLTNAFRERHGLDALKNDAHLNAAAEDWSREMAAGDFFRHSVNPKQMTDHGYDPVGYGENIAAGYQTAKDVVNGWIKSPGHRANLLREDFEHIGIGHYFEANDQYRHYWTQSFGVPADDYLF